MTKKWADFLISEVSYDSEHLISVATRHQDTDQGITKGSPIDRLTIASDIKNGLFYVTIYSGNNSWKKGHKIHTFLIDGNHYLRIDKNKAILDYFGDLPESSFVKSTSIQEPEPEIVTELPSSPRGSLPKESTEELSQELVTELPSSPRGSLPKESTEELSQELEPGPEPEEEATLEQLTQINDLQQQIDDLENVILQQNFTNIHSEEEATPEQFSKVKKLENEIKKIEAINNEHKITQKLEKQNKKPNYIENKLNPHDGSEPKISKTVSQIAYCVKCKTKRTVKNPEETIMKNGRPAIRGFCPVCKSKVFRIGKMKK